MSTTELGKTVARRIRELRHARKWSQVDLEAATGCQISRSEISYLESGKRSPTLGTIAVLADAFEIQAASLLLDSQSDEGVLRQLNAHSCPNCRVDK
jgi:transcriptional regulator with XRE-family HTH domain